MPVLVYNVSVWEWAQADLVEKLGRVVENSWLVIDESRGTIMRVGQSDEALPGGGFEDYDPCIDGRGLLCLPGLQDAHIHVAGTGESASFLNASSCRSITELQHLLAEHCARDENSVELLPWIQGVNWDQTQLGRFPTKEDLDAVCPDRPVFMWRACWHVGVANTCALRAAGIIPSGDAVVPECPEGGSIEIDVATGEPTGLLKERAVELITAIMSAGRTEEQKKHFIVKGLKSCLRFGLTGVQTNDEGCFLAYTDLQRDDLLPIRVFLTPTFDDFDKAAGEDEEGGAIAPIRLIHSACFASPLAPPSFGDNESKLVVERLKIFGDGSLGADTAALRADPASGSPERGILIHSQDKLTSMIQKAKAAGWRLEVHAIGDRAAECILGAFAEAGLDSRDRPILTHCQVLGADLVEQMAALGVVADVQPSFVPTDMRWVSERISPAKQLYSYAWKTLMEHGVVVAGGSDAPIESPDPFSGMYDAMYRESRDAPTRGKPGSSPDTAHQFQPQEALNFSQALWTYTLGAAYAAGAEDWLGRVQAGYAADLVLVDPRVASDCRRLFGCRPQLVFVGGRVLYDAAAAGEGTGAEADAMRGDFVPGKAGCACCRPGGKVARRHAASAAASFRGGGASKTAERWEEALASDDSGALGGAGIDLSEEAYCLVAQGRGKGRRAIGRLK